MGANDNLVLALPKGRILKEVMLLVRRAGIELDRKVLSDLAVHEPESFKSLVDAAQAALGQDASAPKETAPAETA